MVDKTTENLEKWCSAGGIEFIDSEAEAAYKRRARRIADVVQLKVPDRVPVVPSFGMFPYLDNGLTCEEAVFDYEKADVAAMKTLEEALPYRDRIIAVGLDSAEIGNPPSKFQEVFTRAREAGFLTVAHGGEEGPAEYVREALELLKVSRVDHGNKCLDNDELAGELIRFKIPLTVCPLSNLRLKLIDSMQEHPLRRMMEKGLLVTVNSDDPAYFGGYINENYLAITKALNLTADDVCKLARNSFEASFLEESKKDKMFAKVHEYKKMYE